MYAVYRAKRHVQHPGYLLPGAVVQVTVTEYQLLLTAGKPVDCRIDGFLETHQIRPLDAGVPVSPTMRLTFGLTFNSDLNRFVW